MGPCKQRPRNSRCTLHACVHLSEWARENKTRKTWTSRNAQSVPFKESTTHRGPFNLLPLPDLHRLANLSQTMLFFLFSEKQTIIVHIQPLISPVRSISPVGFFKKVFNGWGDRSQTIRRWRISDKIPFWALDSSGSKSSLHCQVGEVIGSKSPELGPSLCGVCMFPPKIHRKWTPS